MLRIIGAIGAIQVVTAVVGLARTKVLAVILGPEGVGVISVVDQVVQTVNYISALSLPFVAVKFLSRAHSEGTEAFQRGYAGFLRLLLLTTTMGTGLGLAFLLLRPDVLGHDLARYQAFLVPALLAVPTASLHGFFSNVFAAAGLARAAGVFLLAVAAALAGGAVLGAELLGIAGFYWLNL